MANLGVVFLTGLTTGGLSCMAVQGGLLASSIAHQAEKDIQHQLETTHAARQAAASATWNRSKRRKHAHATQRTQAAPPARPQPGLAWPIVLFLGAKLITYTMLGFLLGWAGSFLQLTPTMTAALQLAIGVFMIGTALRMLNVHPIFRYFVLEPPSFVTRYLRRLAKNSTRDIATPVFLGALTVLIPCGVTQAMMALAVSAGDPVLGAAILFAFTLGTSPLFFGLFYLAARLGTTMQAHFLKVAAAAVLVLGVLAIDGGLNLLGSPLSLASLTDSPPFASAAPAQPAAVAATVAPAVPPAAPGAGAAAPRPQTGASTTAVDSGQVGSGQPLTVQALDRGYTPNTIRAKAGQPVQLALVTNNTYGCTRAFVIPSLNIRRILPETGTTLIDLPAQPPGTLRFTCSMGMYRGQIQFE